MIVNPVFQDEFPLFKLKDNEAVTDGIWQGELRRRRRASRRPRRRASARRRSLRRRSPRRRRRLRTNRLRIARQPKLRRRKRLKRRRPRRAGFKLRRPKLRRQKWRPERPRQLPPAVAVNIQPPPPPPLPMPPEPAIDYPSQPAMNGGSDAMLEPAAAPLEQGTEFIRWVQSRLNSAMQLNLAVDGVMSPETRSAVRTFQERNKLAVDGIVGPDTKAALLAARQDNGEESPPANEEPDAPEEEYFLDAIWDRFKKPQGHVNRKSRSYIRWVQQALNKIMGQRLTVDGISGPKTRSTVRDFQHRNKRLVVDGIVGPQTEAALIAAGAGQPPRVQTPSGTVPAGGNGRLVPSTSALRNKIVQITQQEWERWQRGRVKEEEPRMRSVLEGYWRKGVGWLPTHAAWWDTVPWSAAFISWVMRQAGAGSDFRYAAAHAVYVAAARENRLAKNSNPFKAYRTSEVAPQPGDLVCKRRQSGVTYDNVRRGHLTHCDVVTAVEPSRLLTIGGNVSDSVTMARVDIDGNGRITDSRYFAVVKVGSAKP